MFKVASMVHPGRCTKCTESELLFPRVCISYWVGLSTHFGFEFESNLNIILQNDIVCGPVYWIGKLIWKTVPNWQVVCKLCTILETIFKTFLCLTELETLRSYTVPNWQLCQFAVYRTGKTDVAVYQTGKEPYLKCLIMEGCRGRWPRPDSDTY